MYAYNDPGFEMEKAERKTVDTRFILQVLNLISSPTGRCSTMLSKINFPIISKVHGNSNKICLFIQIVKLFFNIYSLYNLQE